jgi:Tol biopolymer transport system component
MLPLVGERKLSVFLPSDYDVSSPSLSPDGHWIAYQSNKSDRTEVYVCTFPGAKRETVISQHGGWAPRWRGDGRELFFLAFDGSMMAAGIDTTRNSVATIPQRYFRPLSRLGEINARTPWRKTDAGFSSRYRATPLARRRSPSC